MPIYCYDIECLSNLLTATFINVEDEVDKHVFYIGLDKKEPDDIKKFLNQKMTLVGYNNHSYDDPMLRFILGYRGISLNSDLHSLSNKLVDDVYRSDKQILQLRYPRDIQYSWNSVDLMRILAFDKLGISLKQVAINLKWKKIQDMPISHLEHVSLNQLPLILDYNLNDVLITKALYEELTPIREMRKQLSDIYHVDLTSASDSRVANLILENIYANELKTDIRTIKDMRTRRDKVLLGDCIAKFVKFQTPQLQALYDRVSATYVYQYNNYRNGNWFTYKDGIVFGGCSFVLGIGGLHSEDAPGVFVTDEKFIIQDADVASYYPNLIINNNFYPQHLGPRFITVLEKITAERLAAKKSGDKVKADGLKITVNSIFGKMGSDTFWLLDVKQMLSTTLSGQMGLLMLIEDLVINGIQVISSNTDGVVCKIPRELESKYKEVCKNWENKTNLELEFTSYKKYVRRDVNSYITEKLDGTTKEKGAFVKEVDLKKSYHMPIVAKALYAYFIKGIPVRQTLEECADIMEFCLSQKSGANFGIELHTSKGIQKLQKTNRYFVSKTGGLFMKRDQHSKKLTGLNVGRLVKILNDYDSSIPFSSYEVDLAFYEKQVMKIVDEIEPKQLTLFDFSGLAPSVIIKAPVSAPAEDKEERINVKDINKMGKNQRLARIESVVKNNQRVENINYRYVYIIDFEFKTMTADIYCLGKGVRQSIKINKSAYKKNKIQKGQIVYCLKFEKLDGAHCIANYEITDDIKEINQELTGDNE